MKNIFKNLTLLFALLIAASFTAGAQNSSKTEKVSAVKQETAQQAPAAEKFFNMALLDEKRNAAEDAHAVYSQAAPDKSDALHTEYQKAKRSYIVELERQMSVYDSATETGQKIRTELRRVSVAD